MDLTQKILNAGSMTKPRRKFLLLLFSTILALRGKVNFRNLSRYSGVSARTFSRQFDQPFDFVGFNRRLIDQAIGPRRRLLVFDPCFIPKAGKHTPDRAYFWNGSHGRAEKGLEVSAFSLVDLEHHTGYALSVQQTPAPHAEQDDEETLIDAYLAHLYTVRPWLSADETHLAVDGQFAKKKWLDGVEAVGLHTIGKLRRDADMRFFYTGPPRAKGSGRQKTYAGKIDWQDLSGFDYITEQDRLEVYTQVLNHVSLKRTLRVVVVVDRRKADTPRYALLFSTDLELDPVVLYHLYKARFQIEFIFRDAKQFTGLTQAQTRDPKRLHFHFNASLTTLNIAKIEQRQAQPDRQPMVYSIASVKAAYFNELFMKHFFSTFGWKGDWIKKSALYEKLREFGRIAA